MTNWTQRSKFSCIPVSFCMIMEIDPDEFIAKLGHDDARGFHPQECIKLALSYDWLFAWMEPISKMENGLEVGWRATEIEENLNKFDAVLIGEKHAAAWCSQTKEVWDPLGFRYPLKKFQFIEWVLAVRRNQCVPRRTRNR